MMDQHFLIKKENLASYIPNFRTNPLSSSKLRATEMFAGSCRKVDGEAGANVLLVDFRPATPTTGERISLTGMQTVESQGSNR